MPKGIWGFLTNHGRAVLFIAANPDARLRDLAAELGITERTAYRIVLDLCEGGYVVKVREGRRNRYAIQHDVPLHDPATRQRTVRELLDLLGDSEHQAIP